jgi:hypothetical protein
MIVRALDSNEHVLLASLDFSSANDVVDINILLRRPKIIGLLSDIISLIEDWLRIGLY